MLARPAHDVARSSDDLASVEDQNRYRSLSAQLLYLSAVARSRRPRPQLQRATLYLPPLIGMACLVQCLRGLTAWVQRRRRLTRVTRVQNHVSTLAQRRYPRDLSALAPPVGAAENEGARRHEADRRRRLAVRAPTRESPYLDLPGLGVAGASRKEVEGLIHDAIELHIESLREHGEPVPPPTSAAGVVAVSAA